MEDINSYFVSFPTPHSLREANRKYSELNLQLNYGKDGKLLPYPTPTTKNTIFDVNKFEAEDHLATNVDVDIYDKPLKEFTEYLTGRYKEKDLSIVRIVFRWLAAQDLDRYRDEVGSEPQSVSWCLNRIANNGAYYSEIFCEMCRFAGLQAEVVSGHAKHANLEIGEKPGSQDVNSWVAVVVDKQWRIVDPHWGSSHVEGANFGNWTLIDGGGKGVKDVKTGSGKTAYACNEVYFLTDPEEFIYSHIPKEDECQFLARPVSMREFTEMAYLKPTFFALNLRLLEHKKCVLNSSDGEINIRLALPPGDRMNFIYKLWMSEQQSLDDTKLERFCMMQQKNGILSCRIYFPVTGKFKIELSGKRSDEKTYKEVCAFVIHCDKPAENIKAFPDNVRKEWGPGPDLLFAGLKAVSHEEALIEAEDGTAILRLRMEKPVTVMHQLHSNDQTKEELKNNVIHYIDPDNSEVVLHMRLPEKGDYALNLFAKDEGSEGNLSNVCSYVASCPRAASDTSPYPSVANGQVGPLHAKTGVQFALLSHDSPIIRCPETGEMTLGFQSSVPCDTITELELCTKDKTEKKKNMVWTTGNDNRKNFEIRFQEPGVYVFDVFAKEETAEGGNYTKVYICLIHVPVPMETCVHFPQPFSQWRPTCSIIEPTDGVLAAVTKIKFCVDVPHVNRVSAISSKEWTHLERDEDGRWSGEVETPPAGEDLKLSAEVVKDSNSFTTLLQYQVEENTELEKEIAKQKQLQEDAIKDNQAKEDAEQKQIEHRQEDFQHVKDEFLKAIDRKDLTALQKTLKEVEQKKFVNRLPEEIEEARKLARSLDRKEKLKDAILTMDDKHIQDIASCEGPPEQVHQVMRAALLLLGENDTKTQDWPECQTQINPSLKGRVESFNDKTVPPEQWSQVLEIVRKYRPDDVSSESYGAGLFYTWVAGLIEELGMTEDATEKLFTLPDKQEGTSAEVPETSIEAPVIEEKTLEAESKPQEPQEDATSKDQSTEPLVEEKISPAASTHTSNEPTDNSSDVDQPSDGTEPLLGDKASPVQGAPTSGKSGEKPKEEDPCKYVLVVIAIAVAFVGYCIMNYDYGNEKGK